MEVLSAIGKERIQSEVFLGSPLPGDEQDTFWNLNSVSTELDQKHCCSFLYLLCCTSHFSFAASRAFPARWVLSMLFYLPDFFLYLCLSLPYLLPLISTLLDVILIEIPNTDLCRLCSQQTVAEPGLLPSPGVSSTWQCCSSQEPAAYCRVFFSSVFQN